MPALTLHTCEDGCHGDSCRRNYGRWWWLHTIRCCCPCHRRRTADARR